MYSGKVAIPAPLLTCLTANTKVSEYVIAHTTDIKQQNVIKYKDHMIKVLMIEECCEDLQLCDNSNLSYKGEAIPHNIETYD
jgi:hypothetical protein